MPHQLRPLFTCVIENTPPWYTEAFNLALSIRTSEHPFSSAPVVVNVVDGIEDDLATPLRDLGAELRKVERYDVRSAPCNKLRSLDLLDDREEDALILLDSDALVVGSMERHLATGSIAVCGERYNQLEGQEWNDLYRVLDLSPPSARMPMFATGEMTFPYWSTAFMVIPKEAMPRLRAAWLTNADLILDWFETVDSQRAWFTDQISLSVTLATGTYELSEIGPVEHWLTTTPFGVDIPRDTSPIVIHYGDRIEPSGYIQASEPFPELNQVIDQFNRRRALRLGQEYDGLPRRKLRTRLARKVSKSRWYRSDTVKSIREMKVMRWPRAAWKRAIGQRRRPEQ